MAYDYAPSMPKKIVADKLTQDKGIKNISKTVVITIK